MSNNSTEQEYKAKIIKEAFTINKIRSDSGYGAHWHEHFELKLIVSGQGRVVINGEPYPLQKGCFYFISPANIHSFETWKTIELYNISFHEGYITNLPLMKKLSKLDRMFFQLSEEDFESVFYMMRFLWNEERQGSEYKEQITQNLVESLLMLILRKESSQLTQNTHYSPSVQTAISYTKIHFQEKDITVGKIAAHFGFSMGYFSTLFRKTTGTTFVKFLNELRLEYSKKLLSSERFSINEVCDRSGFSSYANFLKAFKQKYGVLPREYRNSKNNNAE